MAKNSEQNVLSRFALFGMGTCRLFLVHPVLHTQFPFAYALKTPASRTKIAKYHNSTCFVISYHQQQFLRDIFICIMTNIYGPAT